MNEPTKAEILLTRDCNLSCSYCAMRRTDLSSELSPQQWSGIPRKLVEIGVKFAPIYGAEPLMRLQSLCLFIRGAREVGLSTTVITNGILLTSEVIKKLVDSGLTSITLSHDIIANDKSVKLKSEKANSLVPTLFQNFKDVELIVTVTPQNIVYLPNFIRLWSEKGAWIHFDFLHSDRGQKNTKCRGYEKPIYDIKILKYIFGELIYMKAKGYRIHPTEECLKLLEANPNLIQNYNWKCEGGAWITINSNGSTWGCDDFCPSDLESSFNILQFNETWNWEEWLKTWRPRIDDCPGCSWITHIMAVQFWKGEIRQWQKVMTHSV